MSENYYTTFIRDLENLEIGTLDSTGTNIVGFKIVPLSAIPNNEIINNLKYNQVMICEMNDDSLIISPKRTYDIADNDVQSMVNIYELPVSEKLKLLKVVLTNFKSSEENDEIKTI